MLNNKKYHLNLNASDIKYPASIWNQLTQDVRARFLSVSSTHVASPIENAIRKLEIEEVKRFSVLEPQNNEIPHYHLSALFQSANYNYSSQENNARRIEIIKLLITGKPGITTSDLEMLSSFVDKNEFYDFCQANNIDLLSPEFSELDLRIYELDSIAPVFKLPEGIKCHDTVDLILSRTYSNEMEVDSIREVYTHLLNADNIAHEMISHLGMKIAQGDSIKIIIKQDAPGPLYSNALNIIVMPPINDEFINTAATFIHELGHYFYDQVFKNNAIPIGRSEMKYLEQFFSETKPGENHSFKLQHTTLTDNIPQSVSNLWSQYTDAARGPVYKAAELIGFDMKQMNEINTSYDYYKYFGEHSIISLFGYNALSQFTDNDSFELQDLDLKILVPLYLEYYSASQAQCIVLPFGKEVTTQQLVKWTLETFFPKIIEDFDLDSNQIHFLSRISDCINRGMNADYFAHYAELIVRYNELKAAGLEKDLLDSFHGLIKFHQDHASPLAQEELSSYYESCPNVFVGNEDL